MRQSEKIRSRAFWVADLLGGGQLKRHYTNVKMLLENYDGAIATEQRSGYLQRIMTHAAETVPFYKTLAGYASISDFPVINKSIIKENLNDFISESYLTSKLHKVTTSGSTGAPLSIWQDKGKRQRHTAENIFFSELAGSPLGSRLYYLRVWNAMNRKVD